MTYLSTLDLPTTQQAIIILLYCKDSNFRKVLTSKCLSPISSWMGLTTSQYSLGRFLFSK